MSVQVRRLLIAVVVIVVLYFVISQPQGAADTVRNILDLLQQALASIIRFFRALF